MNLTDYGYEAGISDFADWLASAINQVKSNNANLECEHHRYDDKNIAIAHERRLAGSNWEHIAYGYYLKYKPPKNGSIRFRFWLGKVIYPSAHQPHIAIGIWVDGKCSKRLPPTITSQGNDIKARQLPVPCIEHFWDLPASIVLPCGDPLPPQEAPYNSQSAQSNTIQPLVDFLTDFLKAIA